MQRLAFLLLCFLASVLGRRSLPDSSKSNSKTVLPKPTMYMHGWHTPYGWGLPMDEQDFVKQEEKKVKEVKRQVKPKAKTAAQKEHDELCEKRWTIVQDMLEGLE